MWRYTLPQLLAFDRAAERRRSAELVELATAVRAAMHADKDQFNRFAKSLSD